MGQSVSDMLAEARRAVPSIAPAEAAKLLGRPDVLFLDVRDAEELAQSGKIAGALNVSRGMLEFRADDTLPTHNPALSRDRTVVLYCASGGRSALSGKQLLDMGYAKVFNLGAFKDWADGGLPTEPA